MLNRLLLEFNVISSKGSFTGFISSLDEASGLVRGFLSKNNDKKHIIIIDAVDQLDMLKGQAAPIGWLPKTLGTNVHLVVSMALNCIQHEHLKREFGMDWNFIFLQPLDRSTKEEIVASKLAYYNKLFLFIIFKSSCLFTRFVHLGSLIRLRWSYF